MPQSRVQLETTSAWSPLQQPLFRALWMASVASNIGTWMHDVGAAWLMTSLSTDPLMVALVQAATTLPMFLFALPGGALADIVDRRRLLLAAQVWSLLSAGALAALLRPALALEQARPEGQHPVFDKALALIDRHIQSAQLRPEWVAAELGVSLRSLYRLFARQGLVVAQYIRNRRLDLCAQALRSAAGQEKLAGIGLDWGFADHSHFSTAFKQRFGMSPSEYRRQYQ